MSQQAPNYDCPQCDSRMFQVEDRHGTYQCSQCDRRTHEKIETNREAIETLADSDLPISEICEMLAGGDDE